MARSTQTSPSARLKQLSQAIGSSANSLDDDGDGDSDASIEGLLQPQEATRSDSSMDLDAQADDKEDNHDSLDEEAAILQRIANDSVAAAAKGDEDAGLSQRVLLRRIHSSNDQERLAALFAIFLDPVKRSDLRAREFADFVHPSSRNSFDVPKRVGKRFNQQRSEKLLDLYNLYQTLAKLPNVNAHLLHCFEIFLADLMDCIDHPKEAIGFNPFSAFALFVDVGAGVRTPGVIQSCSRLTLGADWSLLSPNDEKRIGPRYMLRLERLRSWRVAEIDDLLCRWSGKFRRDSTCKTCNTDPWELFLLTTLVALKKAGTRYQDKEAASDTSSESGGDEDDDGNGGSEDGEEEDSDDEMDNHGVQDSGSDGSANSLFDGDGNDDENIDPRLVATQPLIDTEEPPRPSTSGLLPRQTFLRNYGPNAYILRIVSMDSFGSEPWKKRTLDACPRCGYRFDGEDPHPKSLYAQDINRAVEVARQQITELQEFIDL